ncbi:MAG TPA: hypothetical protein VJ301_11705 [Propionibacteriaceae bacterium]|nr:hypothetical protein [Propionibacteriaceae bacterium]
MASTKSTAAPGPWTIHDPIATETTQILAAGGMRVADVWCTDLPGGMDNARLIAAAPALRFALIRLSLEATHYRDTHIGREFLTAAIADANALLETVEG